jgi:hypothetical protein
MNHKPRPVKEFLGRFADMPYHSGTFGEGGVFICRGHDVSRIDPENNLFCWNMTREQAEQLYEQLGITLGKKEA